MERSVRGEGAGEPSNHSKPINDFIPEYLKSLHEAKEFLRQPRTKQELIPVHHMIIMVNKCQKHIRHINWLYILRISYVVAICGELDFFTHTPLIFIPVYVIRMRAHPHKLENPVAESTYFFFLRSWYTGKP